MKHFFAQSPSKIGSLVALILAYTLNTFIIAAALGDPVATPAERGRDAGASTDPKPVRPLLPPTRGEQVARHMEDVLSKLDPSIKVIVMTRTDANLVAVLYGGVDTSKIAQIEKKAGQFKPHIVSQVISMLSDPQDTPQKAPETELTVVWPLTFTPDTVGSTRASGASTRSEQAERYKIDSLREVLNSVYGKTGSDGKTPTGPARSARHSLVLRGDARTVLQVKRDLVFLDAPGPQVQLDLWVVQMSGKGKQVDDQVLEINDKLSSSREIMQKVQRSFGGAIHEYLEAKANENPPVDPLKASGVAAVVKLLENVGFDTNPYRPLTFSEVLTFLSILEPGDKNAVLNILGNRVGSLLDEAVATEVMTPEERARIVPLRRFRDLLGTTGHFKASSGAPLPRVATTNPGRQGITDYLTALEKFKELNDELATPTILDGKELRDSDHWIAPETLNRQANTLDRFHESVAEAIGADLQEMLLQPLVKSIKSLQKGNRGTALLGQTRLVVTSGLESGLDPEMTSTVDVTRPAPYDLADVEKLVGSGGLATALPSLSTPQVALARAILSQPDPVYASISPGIAINVRPTVMPNSSAARLQLDARFGVETTFPKTDSRTDVLQPQPFDAVRSHHISTDAIINALDLFGISSLQINTRTPKGPFVTPILGQIPIIGRMFQFKRRDGQPITHHSVILVNSVILPRALDLARFYGAGVVTRAQERTGQQIGNRAETRETSPEQQEKPVLFNNRALQNE